MLLKYLLALILIFSSKLCLQANSSPIRPYQNYTYSAELQPDLATLWWSVDDVAKEITFEFHMKTTGWIALGISPGLFISKSFTWNKSISECLH